MTGPGRPPIGPRRYFRLGHLYDLLTAEAKAVGIPAAELLRRILTAYFNGERYEKETTE
jgi:hypothetical protein